jgi:hypothetical protein
MRMNTGHNPHEERGKKPIQRWWSEEESDLMELSTILTKN